MVGATRAKCFLAAKPCDYCKSTVAPETDNKVHDVNSKSLALSSTSSHERVWMCDQSVTCKADAAALCIVCDNDIHSANPLASHHAHERVPVMPFYDGAESTAASLLVPDSISNIVYATSDIQSDVKFDTQDSFVTDTTDMKSMEFLFSDDQFLDFDYPISSQQPDSVVPVQTMKSPIPTKLTESNISSYNSSYAYTTPSSFSQSVSSSSLDVGVVPEGSCFSESSYSLGVDLSGNQGSQIVGLNREARVLRYREKRKNRKFEKTIRYASRKAYADTRPRIKGRFAKRTEAIESDIDQIFMTDERYRIVPSI